MEKKRLTFSEFIDKLTFQKAFLYWFIYIFIFGLVFFLLSFVPGNGISYKQEALNPSVQSFATIQYFSFINAVSASHLSYNDLFAQGASRIVSIIEAFLALFVIFGLLISKLVSIKQDVILNELYDISFDEKINRLRSGLYLFRAEASKLVDKINSGTASKQEIRDLWLTTTTFDTNLYDLFNIICPNRKNREFVKKVDELKLELILRSIETSMNKLLELVVTLNIKGISWKSEMTSENVNSIINMIVQIKDYYKKESVNKKILNMLGDIEKIRSEIKYQVEEYSRVEEKIIKEEIKSEVIQEENKPKEEIIVTVN
ncbi:MAG: hypothetical protein Q7J54_01970 [Candidatus Woesearchaeota archaeon]|nr:hypothetical protein [Candidatus Woesearchaeota archaeon]